MLIQENLSLEEKLKILSDGAKYDAACTSSGVGRKGKPGYLGNASAAGICHSFASDGRCISLLKILLTNQCVYDCKYCINRCSNDTVRTAFTPQEVCTLTMEFYRRNYIEGLFLSSGVLHSADYTMEQIYQVVQRLRTQYRFNGYIHVKAIPGASPELIEQTGFYADRMSVNLELPTTEGLKKLAPGKTREKILRPMRQIQQGIWGSARLLNGEAQNGERGGRAERPLAAYRKDAVREGGDPFLLQGRRAGFGGGAALLREDLAKSCDTPGKAQGRPFVPGGQSTQMIVGATPESDFQMMSVAQALYHNFGLKRVFYSAYIPVNQDESLPSLPGGPPLLREHRLYQADWLLRFYGFCAEELLSEEQPNFNVFLDPKCDWALRHLELFPVEVNRADYATLLRVPGMGVKSVRRILAARKGGKLDFPDLKKLGVVMKRAVYFITCCGKMMGGIRLDQDYITSCLIGEERRSVWDIEHKDCYRQLSLFDDMKLEACPSHEDVRMAGKGEL